MLINGLDGQNGVNVQPKINAGKDLEAVNVIVIGLLDYPSPLVMNHVPHNTKNVRVDMEIVRLTWMYPITPHGFAFVNKDLRR